MKKYKLLRFTSAGLIGFSAFAILMVSVMAFQNPQKVMDLVQVTLPNNDAFSSIRGVYGGVGLTIAISLVYLAFKDHTKGLVFASILWGSYALSRLMTISMEGPLGAFGTQWLYIESFLCVASVILLIIRVKLLENESALVRA
ncbi:uncharacterized protein DUF4345 [Lacibacter cauensis]|uniref:Uncharacterized protein DUF4345 n=1 Tax=Lacibacter cauensis TaxID=510947 RepID=A0A562SJA9_9BACT|nr:DUF4345 domain-containing protein [Lacibacter cauensis]TWI81341.1 uncharacterized protein DUF4345 [Lacibacter cauensis]